MSNTFKRDVPNIQSASMYWKMCKALSDLGGADLDSGPCPSGGCKRISEDAVIEWLHREKGALQGDLKDINAKFDSTMKTLRSTLRLGDGAPWTDVLEQAEAISRRSESHSLGSPSKLETTPVPETDMDKALLEKKQLEERLDASEQECKLLRELLLKEQQMHDMTNARMAELRDQNEKHLSRLEITETSQQEANTILSSKMEAAMSQSRIFEEEVRVQTNVARSFEEQFLAESQKRREEEGRVEEQARLIADLKENLARKDAECMLITEMAESLKTASAANERYREKLQDYEAADRRTYSYASRSSPERRRSSIGTEITDDTSVSDAVASPREAALALLSGMSKCRRSGPKANSSKNAQAPMDDAERDAFLSQFPMASRTERQLRNRMELERSKTLP